MTDKEEYYFVSYAWQFGKDWKLVKEELKKGIITPKEEWNFAEECIKIHPFNWIDQKRTCCGTGNPTNTNVALLYWCRITKEDYNIWLSTEHRNHY